MLHIYIYVLYICIYLSLFLYFCSPRFPIKHQRREGLKSQTKVLREIDLETTHFILQIELTTEIFWTNLEKMVYISWWPGQLEDKLIRKAFLAFLEIMCYSSQNLSHCE